MLHQPRSRYVYWVCKNLAKSLRSKRIYDFQKRELIKIGIPRADAPDAVFAHENCRVRVVQQVTGKMRQLQNDLFCNIGMPVCRDKNCEARRGQERRHKPPCRSRGPGASHDPWMRGYAQKLVDYSPSGVPGVGPRALAFKPMAARSVELGINVSGINQNICVDSEH
jgi:hypothetical protein